ncbi:biogenesis of lysosome-related organelles complex-1 subunit 2-domain-containing protein [Radiomyces spectabilis]|uniref:biogenesis of lysosome-related organelles complex-1 subunit 2-domain-containing protein n=1 Tax=Radiomyces spectabilis TaxID=64574 RepID=UPI002220C24C|nr:biogenesis of lysosome-related organelles complex-1 subunit 2-domain-containing protein [Radiomyces spectabilis]KAI8367694.1 biogenesis of lysosome-related organelles complex-1 subunit 2-domain-containing protein [Radiomyces spectabilis]
MTDAPQPQATPSTTSVINDTMPSVTSGLLRSRNTTIPGLNPDEAAKMLNEEYITRLSEEAFRKLAEYTRAELLLTMEDCQLLETMNTSTREKYSQMSQMSQRLMKEMSKLQNTYADFATFMRQVDDINQQTIDMETTAKALNAYSQQLEIKLNQSHHT